MSFLDIFRKNPSRSLSVPERAPEKKAGPNWAMWAPSQEKPKPQPPPPPPPSSMPEQDPWMIWADKPVPERARYQAPPPPPPLPPVPRAAYEEPVSGRPFEGQFERRSRMPDPEAFASRIRSVFNLDRIWDEARAARTTSWFRRAVDDSPHTGEPALAELGPVADLGVASEVFGIDPGTLERDWPEFSDLATAAFEILKPDDLPGVFILGLAADGAILLDYLEVKYQPGLSGFFDFLKKKKPGSTGLTPFEGGPWLPAKFEEKGPGLLKRIFSIFKPNPERRPRPGDPMAMWAPGAREAAPFRGPEQEQGPDPFSVTVYRPEEPKPSGMERFSVWATPPEAPSIAPYVPPPAPEIPPMPPAPYEEPEREIVVPPEYAPARSEIYRDRPPTEEVREGKRYYVPWSPREIADRMLEIYGADGIARMKEAILEEREEPGFRYTYLYWAWSRGNSYDQPAVLLEHMSISERGMSDLEILSEFFNIPLDYMMSFFGDVDPDSDEGMERWDELRDNFLGPLYYERVPAAFELLIPGLPGEIIMGTGYSGCTDSCPEMVYVEFPPKGLKVTKADLDQARIKLEEAGESVSEEMEDDDGGGEGELEAESEEEAVAVETEALANRVSALYNEDLTEEEHRTLLDVHARLEALSKGEVPMDRADEELERAYEAILEIEEAAGERAEREEERKPKKRRRS